MPETKVSAVERIRIAIQEAKDKGADPADAAKLEEDFKEFLASQVAEILVMLLLLPLLISKIGIRKILVLGVLAWPVRYIIFAVGAPSWLVIASLALHGFCFVFFFVAAFIYTDMVAPRDIRHSAQSLITLVTYGFGNYVGSLFAGWARDWFTTDAGTNWTGVFLIPCALTILCAVAFLLFFKEEATPKLSEQGRGTR